MRVLIAPDKFAGSLSAGEAATAIADGWRATVPSDEVDVLPLSDGGPGFLDALGTAVGRSGRTEIRTVRGPYGDPVKARLLLVGTTAYVESAEACGLHLHFQRRT